MSRTRSVCGSALLLLLSVPGCARMIPWLPPAFRPCASETPMAPAALGSDFRWRAQASFHVGGEERGALDLVVEKRGNRLVLVAFDRAGLRALSAVQEGDVLQVDPAPGRRRPVAAQTLLVDVGRLRAPDGADPPVVILRDLAQSGAPRARVQDPRCGTESVYVTSEDRSLP